MTDVDPLYPEALQEIADEFDVPLQTAAAWNRHIGDLEEVERVLGANAPDGYLDFVREREHVLEDRSNREDQWTSPLEEHVLDQIDGISLMRNPEVHEEFRRKCRQVRYEMRRFDTKWIELTHRLRRVESQLIRIYRTHLAEREIPFEKKKHKIIELKTTFPYLRANNGLTAKAADSSRSYAEKFKHIPGEGIAQRRLKGKSRDRVLERDDQSCVSCGDSTDLVVHHIIPRSGGGTNELENLATLCSDCHYFAHGGGKPTGDDRFTAAVWKSVDYEDADEFWEQWVDTDFRGYSTRSVGNTDSE